MLENLSYSYKWNLDYIYDLDFYDAIYFNKRIRAREESRAKADLRKLQMLTIAIHTGEPNEFVEEINRSINNEESIDEVGNLDELEKLKYRRQGYRR